MYCPCTLLAVGVLSFSPLLVARLHPENDTCWTFWNLLCQFSLWPCGLHPLVYICFIYPTSTWRDVDQCVKQTLRVRCPPLNWGGGWGRLREAAAGGVVAQPKFFLELLSSDHFSYRIWCLGQIMYTFRGCESHDFCTCHSTFLSVNALCHTKPEHFFLWKGKKPKQEGSWKRGYRFRTVLKEAGVLCDQITVHSRSRNGMAHRPFKGKK